MYDLLVQQLVGREVCRGQVRGHVGLHQVHVEVLVQHEVEPNHLEEGGLVGVVGQRLDEQVLMDQVHLIMHNKITFRF